MKQGFYVKIGAIIVISVFFLGLLSFTNVYEEVRDKIVKVKCLSCLKLDPRTERSFTFLTANGEKHPDFVMNNLTEGVVFLHYSEDACPGCDIMLPIVQDLFNVSFGKEDMFYKKIVFDNGVVNYYYINIDHSTEERVNSYDIYDMKHVQGLPMFVVVTLGYDRGFIKPYYVALYGTLGFDKNIERFNFLKKIVEESLRIYDENKAGFNPS